MAGRSESNGVWDYEAAIVRHDGRVFIRVPPLHLVAEGPDVATAAAALETAFGALAERYRTMEVALPPSRNIELRRNLLTNVLPFLIKAASIGVVGVILVISAAIGIRYTLGEPLRHAAQRTAHAAVEQIILGLEDSARRDLTPDRRARLREAVRGIVPLLKPFIVELNPLFTDDPAPQSR